MLIVSNIQGASSSIRNNTLESMLEKIDLSSHGGLAAIKTFNPWLDDESIEWLLSIDRHENHNLLLTGKSLGAIRQFFIWKEYNEKLSQIYNKIYMILVDPHGWQPCDGMIGSYHKRRSLEEPINVHRLESCTAIYQDNEWPTGAKFNSYACNNQKIMIAGCNHWNIEDIDTTYGKAVLEIFNNELKKSR